jgi:Rad3-related DNA helicase
MIQETQKKKISERAALYVQRYPSQNMAANSLKGISAATLSNIVNGKWDRISDEMWLRLDSQLVSHEGWQIFSTSAYRDMTLFLGDSQTESSVMWVTAPAGTGKSTAAASYAALHPHVYRLTCASDMTRTDFVHELARNVGVRTSGMSVREAFSEILRHLVTLERPLLIFDEADKLADSVMYYFISIYNALEDRCGIVFLSTDAIKKRIRHGVLRDKKGYDELESRIGRRFVDLSPVNAREVEQICYANGLQDRAAIAKVKADAAEHGNDLRRVKRAVHRELRRLGLSDTMPEEEA